MTPEPQLQMRYGENSIPISAKCSMCGEQMPQSGPVGFHYFARVDLRVGLVMNKEHVDWLPGIEQKRRATLWEIPKPCKVFTFSLIVAVGVAVVG